MDHHIFYRTEAELLETEKDTLQAKLITIEREGRDTSKEMEKLRDSCRKLKQVRYPIMLI